MILSMAALLWMRCSIEGRRVKGDNMAPAINIGDIVIFDISSYRLGSPFQRGQIVLFYPYYLHVQPDDLNANFMNVVNRAVGPPSLISPEASIKRVIALPGERVEVKRNEGVFINGKLLNEPYVKEPATYDLHQLKDMGGLLNLNRGLVCPYPGRAETIVVPPDSLFVLGDNRNESEDSHQWGFLKQNRVIGKAAFVSLPVLHIFSNPNY